MFVIKRIFANLPFEGWVELHNNDFINDVQPNVWIKTNNIEDYCFINVTYKGIQHKLHISNIQFM